MAIQLLTLLCVLNHAGFAGSRMVMSLYALELGAGQFEVGAIMALYALWPMLLALHAGRLIDRVGPRLPMLAGTAGTALGLAFPYFFPGLWAVYAAAVILGTSFNFFFVAVHGTAGAIGGPEHRVRNYTAVAIGFSLAAFIGPLLGGFAIDHLGYLAAFLVLASCTIPPLLLLWLGPAFLPGATPGAAAGARAGSPLDLLREPRLLNIFVASGLISAAWDLYQFYFPIYGHALGLSASTIGMIMASFAAAVFAIRVVLPSLVRRWGELEILLSMIAVAGISFVLFPLTGHPLLLAGASFLLGLGVGCGQPLSGALIFTLAPAGRAAEGAGMRVVFNNVTHLTVPLAFGAIGTAFGFAPVFLSCAALLLAGSYFGLRAAARHGAL